MNVTVRPGEQGKFDAYLGSRLLFKGSSSPFFMAAIILKSEGAPAFEPFTMTYEGTDTIIREATIGEVANWRVQGDHTGLCRPHTPNPFAPPV